MRLSVRLNYRGVSTVVLWSKYRFFWIHKPSSWICWSFCSGFKIKRGILVLERILEFLIKYIISTLEKQINLHGRRVYFLTDTESEEHVADEEDR